MKSVQHLFADLTAALEDVHSVAVEGQAHTATPDIQAALLPCVRLGITRLQTIATSIEAALGRRKG